MFSKIAVILKFKFLIQKKKMCIGYLRKLVVNMDFPKIDDIVRQGVH